jgi:hypothetical protein
LERVSFLEFAFFASLQELLEIEFAVDTFGYFRLDIFVNLMNSDVDLKLAATIAIVL